MVSFTSSSDKQPSLQRDLKDAPRAVFFIIAYPDANRKNGGKFILPGFDSREEESQL
jgi:hypothetical protein